jgi:hypothetical protein
MIIHVALQADVDRAIAALLDDGSAAPPLVTRVSAAGVGVCVCVGVCGAGRLT